MNLVARKGISRKGRRAPAAERQRQAQYKRTVERRREHVRDRVLSAYGKTATVTDACAAGRITTNTFYRWLSEDAHFRERIDSAKQRVCDKLEAEAQRRAIGGKSDSLLVFLLRGHNPDRYGQKREIKGSVDFNLSKFDPEAIKRLSSEELTIMRRGIRKLRGLPVDETAAAGEGEAVG